MNNNPAQVLDKEQGEALVAVSLIKRYAKSDRPALNNLDLRIKEGEFFGLLGANGAGKTTAVSVFSGFLPTDSGSVTILGMDLRRKSRQIRRMLGLVPQEIALYDRLTARENLQFFGKLYGFTGKKLMARVEECLEFAQLSSQATRLVASYSGGMKRRLNLATGLLHLPRILFLDEPTVGIDTQSRHLIHNQLTELNRNGTTILYTTHYMKEAQELCSRVGIIDAGRIIEEGVPSHMLVQSGCHNLEELFLRLTGKQLRDS